MLNLRHGPGAYALLSRHQTRLGRAIKRGWGEPSNKVGRASTKLLDACFKAAPWRYGASAHARSDCAYSAVPSASSARARSALHRTGVPTFLQVPARHWGACSARARSAHLLASACSTRARSAHLVTSARSALCPLGTA